jgi:hypothetical protein
VRGRDTVRIERLGDLAETPTARILQLDPIDDARRQRRRPARRPLLRASTRRLEVLPNESLELCDGNEPLTPRRLDRAHSGDEAAIDRRDANAERLGSLLAAVGEAIDIANFVQLTRWSPANLRLGLVVPPSLPFAAPLPSRGHRWRTVIRASDSTCGASVSGVLSGCAVGVRRLLRDGAAAVSALDREPAVRDALALELHQPTEALETFRVWVTVAGFEHAHAVDDGGDGGAGAATEVLSGGTDT